MHATTPRHSSRRAAAVGSLLAVTVTLTVTLASTAAASAATPRSVAYINPLESDDTAFLVDWQAGAHAHLVTWEGRGDGTVGTDAQGRHVITLDPPIATVFATGGIDCHGNPFPIRQDILQVGFLDVDGNGRKGRTEVSEAGTTTDLGGCTPGHVTPWGDADVPYWTMDRRDMAARPPITDLGNGASLAGWTETDLGTPPAAVPVADVTTMGPGQVVFQATGHVVPRTLQDGWMVLAMPSGPVAWTRIEVEVGTGRERWLMADWDGTRPTWVLGALVVTPRPGAGFGTPGQAARVWENGLFVGYDPVVRHQVYKDGTGVKRNINADGTETDAPFIWHFAADGVTMIQDRAIGNVTAERTWVPLANHGKTHWVMESLVNWDGGVGTPIIVPRVVNLLNEGPAWPGMGASSARASAPAPAPALPPAARHQPGSHRPAAAPGDPRI